MATEQTDDWDGTFTTEMKQFIQYCQGKYGTDPVSGVEQERDAYKQLLLDVAGGTWVFPEDFQMARGGRVVCGVTKRD